MKQLEEKTKEMERLNEAVDEGRRRVGEVELVGPQSLSERRGRLIARVPCRKMKR